MRTAIFVNNAAANCTAGHKWKRIRKEVMKCLPGNPIEISPVNKSDYKRLVSELMFDAHVKFFVAAGGDGTVNLLLNAIMACDQSVTTGACLGGIGLGSSNDFLKPVFRQVSGIPVKLDYLNPVLSDVGCLHVKRRGCPDLIRYFVINTSLGWGAEANALFNQGDPIIHFLKSRAVSLCIAYSILKALINHHNQDLRLLYDRKEHRIRSSVFSLIQKPYLSGSLHFPEYPSPGSGQFCLYLMDDLNGVQLLWALIKLSHGRFDCSHKFYKEYISEITVQTDHPVAVETDGEVTYGTQFKFSILKQKILLANY